MASSSSQPREAEAPSSEGNTFRPSFVREPLSTVLLDFETVRENGDSVTYEGRIKRHMLTDGEEARGVIAIIGPGGVGKSTIAKGLMIDDDVRKKFSDGVHLISLGMNATPATIFHELCKVMRSAGAVDTVEKLQAQNDVEHAIREAISWFSGKRCVFFIDDVWTSQVGTGLISRLCRLGIEERRSTVVLTTREADVSLLAHRADRIRVDPRQPEGTESEKILFCHAGVTHNESSEEAADGPLKEVLKTCGGLPVCLAAAGKGVKMLLHNAQEPVEDPWAEYLVNLPNYRQQLLEEHLDDYGNLYSTFMTSLVLLDKQRKQKLQFVPPYSFTEMYRRLCVLQKQAKVPARMLSLLWDLKNDSRARSIGNQLEQVGLAEVVHESNSRNWIWSLRIHDSLHDFAVSEARRHGDTAYAHRGLLNGYRAESALSKTPQGCTQWWSEELKKDGYIHRNLCRHLKESGEVEELVKLLKTPAWILCQLGESGIWAMHDDFTTGITAVLKINEEWGSQDETVLRLIREALVLSFGFISKNSTELWFQLYGRLLGHQDKCAEIKTFLYQIRLWVKDRWLRSINSFLESPGSSTIRMIDAPRSIHCMTSLERTDCVACGCNDGMVLVVNVIQGVIEKNWFAHGGKVCTIASGKRGTKMITGGIDMCAAVWDVNSGDLVVSYRGHSSCVNSVVAMANGQCAASASEDGVVLVWHMETGETFAALMGYGPVRRIAALPEGKHLVTGGADGTLRVWDIESRSQIGEPLLGYNKFMNYIALTADGTRVISGSWDEALRIQSANPVERIGVISETDVLIELDAGVECISLSNDGKYIVSGHANGKIRLWDVTSGHPIGNTLEGHSDRIRDISFLGSSDVVVSVSCDGQIRVWDVFRMTQVSQSVEEEKITKVLFTPTGDHVITGSSDGSLRIWETSSGRQIGKTLIGHAGSISDLAVNPDGSRIVSVSNEKDRTVRVWNADSQKQLAELGWHTGWISSIAVTPSCDYVVAGSLDKKLYLWNLSALDNESFFSVLEGHTEWVLRVYLSADGNRIISVGDSGEVFVWDILTRRCMKQCKSIDPWDQPRGRIMALVNEPIASDSCNTSISSEGIRIVGREITCEKYPPVLGTMECDIKSEAFSADGKMFCVGLRNGQIALMKVEEEIRAFKAEAEEVISDAKAQDQEAE